MIISELKWLYGALASLMLFAIGCSLLVFSSHKDLQQQLKNNKSIQSRESGKWLAAVGDQRRFRAYRESYDAVMADTSRFSHNRIALLGYLSTLNAEVAPSAHSFSILPARGMENIDQNLLSVRVSVVDIVAKFHHENHLFEYLWHIELQQIALLKVVSVDVSTQPGEQPSYENDTSPLTVKIRLQWFSLKPVEAGSLL